MNIKINILLTDMHNMHSCAYVMSVQQQIVIIGSVGGGGEWVEGGRLPPGQEAQYGG